METRGRGSVMDSDHYVLVIYEVETLLTISGMESDSRRAGGM